MLFLAYVKGDLVHTWVLAASRWLGQEVALVLLWLELLVFSDC
jgi:hypothetical protein